MTRPRTPSQAKAAGDTRYAISWQEYCEHLIGIDKDDDGPKLVMKLDDEGNYALVMNLEEAKLFSGHIFKMTCELSRRCGVDRINNKR